MKVSTSRDDRAQPGKGLRGYFQAYLRGLQVISRGEQGPQLGCSGLLFAALFLGMGLLFSFFTGNRVQLECIRAEAERVDCRILSRWYGLVPLAESQVENLQAASLEVYCDEDDCSYRILLATNRGGIPLTQYYSANRRPKEGAVQAIEEFLADPQAETLAVQAGSAAEGGIANLLPPILAGLGLLFGYFSWQGLRRRPEAA